jgi:FkbM family methyltransferase
MRQRALEYSKAYTSIYKYKPYEPVKMLVQLLGDLELQLRPPVCHRAAFAFAKNGWRGSQFVWKVAARVQKVTDGEKIRLPNRFPLLTDANDWISKTIYEGTYERALLSFLGGLELAEMYIDVGANIGVTLWHSMKGSKPTASFMVFEPSTQCFAALGNTRLDISNQGQIFHYAIGNTDGKATLFGLDNQAHSGAASLSAHPGIRGGQGEVQVRKLDTILGELRGKQTISLLKIDTEGYEAQVVEGAHETLLSGKVEIIVMEISPNFGSVEFLITVDQLLGDKYCWFYLDESGVVRKTPYLLVTNLSQALKYIHQWNLVLMRKDVFAIYEKSQGRIRIASLSTK